MTLFKAHKLLIATATLFCTGFALRELFRILEGKDGKLLILLASGAAAVGLGNYLSDLLKRTSLSPIEASAQQSGPEGDSS